MPLYWIAVAVFSGFAAFLAAFSDGYWIAALLVLTGGLTGDCLQDLFGAADAGPRRARKWLCASLALLLVGACWNIALFLVPGGVGLFGLLFACIARDLAVLRAS